MIKWPIAIVMIIISAVLLLLSAFVFPIYGVSTEGELDPDGTNDRNNAEEFTVTEKYYLTHYQLEASHEMFDTNDDGRPDSKTSPEYKYSDSPDLSDSATSNNYGWNGDVKQYGQPNKGAIYSYSFYAFVASLVVGALMLIIVPLSGFRLIPGIIPKILGVVFILACIVYPIVLGIFLSGAYEDDDNEYFKMERRDTSLSYKATDVGDTFMGEIKSQSAGGKDFNFYTDESQITQSSASSQDYFYISENATERHWNSYYGAQVAAEYSLDNRDSSVNNTASTVWVDKIRYGPWPNGYGWFMGVGGIFFAIAAWALSDQNKPKEYDYDRDRDRGKKDDFREDYGRRDYDDRGRPPPRDDYYDDRGRGRDPYQDDYGGGRDRGGYDRGRDREPPPPPPRGGGGERGGPRLGPQ
jgi:hypothetical protein